MCTLHLADMGADVIKIEECKTGDYARLIPPAQKVIKETLQNVVESK